MSRLSFHEKSDRRKWAAVTIAILLIAAVIVSGICTDWFTEKNKFCLFGHDYDEAGKCIRCGKDKPIETEDEPQAFVSESYRMDIASAKRLNANSVPSANSSIWTEVTVGHEFSVDYLYRVRISDLPSISSTLYTIDLFSCDGTHNLLNYASSNGVIYYLSEIDYYGDISVDSFLENEPNSASLDETYITFNCIDEVDGCECSEIGDITVEYYALPTPPQKTGYTFTGWYTDEACTHKYDASAVTGDITLYAGFRANNYSVKFNANGGSGSMANEAMTYNQAKNLTSNAFTREYYAFKGWATSANGSVVYSDKQSVKNLTANDGAVVNLFAVWERNAIVVTYVVDGKTTTATSMSGAAVNLPANPTKEGHTFDGWYLADGTKYTGQVLSEDTVLTAKFEIIKCTVTFIVDGEVYAVCVYDWGTSLSDALNASDINPVLLKTEDEYSRNF